MRRISLLLLLLALTQAAATPDRIVTLAPGLSEIVVALGAESRMVGRSRFCDHPPRIRRLPEVGGLWDPNLEQMVRLDPDLVILYPEQRKPLAVLDGRIRRLVVPHRSLEDLYGSIRAIAAEIGLESRGRALEDRLKTNLRDVSARVRGRAPVPVLLIAGRNPEQLRNITLIGRGDFLNTLIEIAGGVNAYRGDIPYPTVSLEAVIAMRPEHIFEFSLAFESIPHERVRALWAEYPLIPAVKQNRIHIVTDPVWVRPGPRIDTVAQRFLRLLHPQNGNPRSEAKR